MTDVFLRIKDVLQKTGLKRSSLYRLIKKGEFPNQIEIGPRARAWSGSSVTQWMNERMSGTPLGEKAKQSK